MKKSRAANFSNFAKCCTTFLTKKETDSGTKRSDESQRTPEPTKADELKPQYGQMGRKLLRAAVSYTLGIVENVFSNNAAQKNHKNHGSNTLKQFLLWNLQREFFPHYSGKMKFSLKRQQRLDTMHRVLPSNRNNSTKKSTRMNAEHTNSTYLCRYVC